MLIIWPDSGIYGQILSFTTTIPDTQGIISDQKIKVSELFNYQFPTDLFIDYKGQKLSYTATLEDGSPLPGWLNFDPNTRIFSGTPTPNDKKSYYIKVTATNTDGLSISSKFVIAVIDNNPNTNSTNSNTETNSNTNSKNSGNDQNSNTDSTTNKILMGVFISLGGILIIIFGYCHREKIKKGVISIGNCCKNQEIPGNEIPRRERREINQMDRNFQYPKNPDNNQQIINLDQIQILRNIEIPENMICTFSQGIMVDPVITAANITYDRAGI